MTDNKGKAFFMMEDDYSKYEEKLKKAISRMVTTPDPKDGHTHVVYIDTNGNGMTTYYPEDQEQWFSHTHLVVDSKVVLFTDGYSISFHTSLQTMAEQTKVVKEKEEAKKKDNSEESEASSLSDVFTKEIVGGKVGNGIKDEREKETDKRIDEDRRKLDNEMKSKLKKK